MRWQLTAFRGTWLGPKVLSKYGGGALAACWITLGPPFLCLSFPICMEERMKRVPSLYPSPLL